MKELSLHITDRCNLRCSFCVWGESLRRSGEGVPRDDLEGFLLAYQGRGYERVNLHGGEPTLRSDLFPLLERVRALGYREVSIQTNGWLLADHRFAKRLVRAGVSLVVVSLHGPTPRIHDEITGVRGSLDRALRGIHIVSGLGSQVRTNTVVTSRNLAGLTDTVAAAVSAGASHVNLSALMPSGRAVAELATLSPRYTEVRPRLQEAVACADRNGAKVTLEGFPPCLLPEAADRFLHRSADAGTQVTCFIRGQVWDDHDAYVERHTKVKAPACAGCALTARCAGVYIDYARANGWSEFHPLTGHPARRPAEGIRHASR